MELIDEKKMGVGFLRYVFEVGRSSSKCRQTSKSPKELGSAY
jgi:hypothetical protein